MVVVAVELVAEEDWELEVRVRLLLGEDAAPLPKKLGEVGSLLLPPTALLLALLLVLLPLLLLLLPPNNLGLASGSLLVLPLDVLPLEESPLPLRCRVPVVLPLILEVGVDDKGVADVVAVDVAAGDVAKVEVGLEKSEELEEELPKMLSNNFVGVEVEADVVVVVAVEDTGGPNGRLVGAGVAGGGPTEEFLLTGGEEVSLIPSAEVRLEPGLCLGGEGDGGAAGEGDGSGEVVGTKKAAETGRGEDWERTEPPVPPGWCWWDRRRNFGASAADASASMLDAREDGEGRLLESSMLTLLDLLLGGLESVAISSTPEDEDEEEDEEEESLKVGRMLTEAEEVLRTLLAFLSLDVAGAPPPTPKETVDVFLVLLAATLLLLLLLLPLMVVVASVTEDFLEVLALSPAPLLSALVADLNLISLRTEPSSPMTVLVMCTVAPPPGPPWSEVKVVVCTLGESVKSSSKRLVAPRPPPPVKEECIMWWWWWAKKGEGEEKKGSEAKEEDWGWRPWREAVGGWWCCRANANCKEKRQKKF